MSKPTRSRAKPREQEGGTPKDHEAEVPEDEAIEDDDEESSRSGKERRKIEIKFIQDKSRRHITFSKRKHGIMKKAWELSMLTGTQVLLLVVSETGLVYTYTTPKLQPLVTRAEGKSLIQECLNAPDPSEDDQEQEQPQAAPPVQPNPPPVNPQMMNPMIPGGAWFGPPPVRPPGQLRPEDPEYRYPGMQESWH